MIPQHRLDAIVAGLPALVGSRADLEQAIRYALLIFRLERFGEENVATEGAGRKHVSRIASTARKLSELLADGASVHLFSADFDDEVATLLRRLGEDLPKLCMFADEAVGMRSPPGQPDAVEYMLTALVEAYETATGQEARQPTYDPILCTISGPLADFIRAATADAFRQRPLSDDALRHRLRMILGGRRQKNSTRRLWNEGEQIGTVPPSNATEHEAHEHEGKGAD